MYHSIFREQPDIQYTDLAVRLVQFFTVIDGNVPSYRKAEKCYILSVNTYITVILIALSIIQHNKVLMTPTNYLHEMCICSIFVTIIVNNSTDGAL
jgi:hypothetical protein